MKQILLTALIFLVPTLTYAQDSYTLLSDIHFENYSVPTDVGVTGYIGEETHDLSETALHQNKYVLTGGVNYLYANGLYLKSSIKVGNEVLSPKFVLGYTQKITPATFAFVQGDVTFYNSTKNEGFSKSLVVGAEHKFDAHGVGLFVGYGETSKFKYEKYKFLETGLMGQYYFDERTTVGLTLSNIREMDKFKSESYQKQNLTKLKLFAEHKLPYNVSVGLSTEVIDLNHRFKTNLSIKKYF